MAVKWCRDDKVFAGVIAKVSRLQVQDYVGVPDVIENRDRRWSKANVSA